MSRNNPEQLTELTRRFTNLLEVAPCLAPIYDESAYQAALDTIEALLQSVGDDPEDPRHLLVEMILHQTEAYEYRTHPILSQWDQHEGTIALLKTLMRQHHLKQSELPEIGSQGVVSEVLSGKRSLNLVQVQKLAERFGLEPGLFMSVGERH